MVNFYFNRGYPYMEEFDPIGATLIGKNLLPFFPSRVALIKEGFTKCKNRNYGISCFIDNIATYHLLHIV